MNNIVFQFINLKSKSPSMASTNGALSSFWHQVYAKKMIPKASLLKFTNHQSLVIMKILAQESLL